MPQEPSSDGSPVALQQENEQLRKRLAEETARRESSEAEQQMLTDGLSELSIGVDIVDSNFQVLYQNPYLERRFGKLVGTPCHQGYMDRDDPCPFCPMPRALASGTSAHAELQGSDGRHYLLQTAAIPAGDGADSKVIEVVIDITVQKEALMSSARDQESMALLTRTAMDFVQAPPEASPFAYIGQTLHEIVGPGSYVIVSHTDSFSPQNLARPAGDHAAFLEKIETILARRATRLSNPSPGPSEAPLASRTLKKLDGGLFELADGELSPEVCADLERIQKVEDVYTIGVACGEKIVASVTIITQAGRDTLDAELIEAFLGQASVALERRRSHDKLHNVEAQLRASQKMEAIGRLAGGVAHDFNNLLAAIVGHADIMVEAIHQQDPLRQSAVEILNTARRATEVTGQLLAFSRTQALQVRPLDINKVIQKMEGMLRRLLHANIQLELKLDPECGIFDADGGQMEQVLLNLVMNARDAMPEGGTLAIQTDPIAVDETYAEEQPELEPGPYVMLAVSDTGTGMDPATRSMIFEPFFSTKPRESGSNGLGLSTAYGIVKQSGGHITVYSEPDYGTVFKMFFPRSDRDRAVSQPPPSIAAPARGSGEHVLVAEDEAVIRRLVVQVLSRAGYTVTEASDGEAALQTMRQAATPFDLLVTDVVMPGLTGRQLSEHSLREWPTTRVLFMSGYLQNVEGEPDALRPGDFFLQKPFTAKGLLTAVRNVLDSN